MTSEETPNQLLDAAQTRTQERGYNAFSHKDLAEGVGIRTASSHGHFPGKASLELARIERCVEQLRLALAALAVLAVIDGNGRTNKAKRKSFAKLCADTEARGAICLCGSLASVRETLPEDPHRGQRSGDRPHREGRSTPGGVPLRRVFQRALELSLGLRSPRGSNHDAGNRPKPSSPR